MFTQPVQLVGEKVTLISLQKNHFDELFKIAQHKEIWQELPINGADESVLKQELQSSLYFKLEGSHFPYVIIDNHTNSIIGSTRFFDISFEHKKIEIGWTWMTPKVWGTGANTEAKYLMLSHAFEIFGCHRVQLKTRSTNLRSRRAIEKIGGIYEGCLRMDRVMHDGAIKDTHVYSIIEPEWLSVKENLLQQLQKNKASHT